MLAVVSSGALRGAGDVKYTARVMMLTVAFMRPVLALIAVYLLGTVLGKEDIALIGCWSAALIDMTLRMILMMHRYHGGKWHDIRV
jgi:Na+-driven multidrug efflux pump